MYNLNEVLNDKKMFFHVTKQIFDAVDSDGSGKISEDELFLVVCSLADDFNFERPTIDETHEILRKVDMDKSGVVDLREFRKLIKKVLKAIQEDQEEVQKEENDEED